MTEQTPAAATTKNNTPLTSSPAVAAKRKVRRVMDQHMRIADNITWKVVVPVDWTIADLNTPEAWINVAKRMNRGDTVIVYPDDLTWRAEFLVLATEHIGNSSMVKTRLLQEYSFTEDDLKLDAEISSDYAVKWKGESAGYGVFRKADGQYIRDQFIDRNAAHLWLAGYLKSQKH